VVLEQKVTERTQELRESNEHLKRTQSQLVNSEKMASIGQLTAGIAHEINNPVNFISSNIPPLRRNISEMMEVLQRYRTINAGSTVPEISELRETEDQLGIDDSISETTEILNSIENGAGRTAEIVRGLRNFSRLDEGDLKAADVNEGLRSTLAVLSPHVRDKVKIDLDLGGLPAIECYPGKLNQVFMNILTNAAQACKTVHPEGGGLITVRTRTEGEHVEVLITDNGPGFTAEVKNRMFEPFYTTKGVGEGTGLGLSIAYGIIEKHEGSIDAESAPGEGATFRILLPIQRQPNAKRA
jgi:signal transduction histidine kinase